MDENTCSPGSQRSSQKLSFGNSSIANGKILPNSSGNCCDEFSRLEGYFQPSWPVERATSPAVFWPLTQLVGIVAMSINQLHSINELPAPNPHCAYFEIAKYSIFKRTATQASNRSTDADTIWIASPQGSWKSTFCPHVHYSLLKS